MIKIKGNNDFSETRKYLKRISNAIKSIPYESYANKGLEALKNATPIDSGLTSESWSYKIIKKSGKVKIEYYNSNNNKGTNIAIIIQYGHALPNGGYVEGIDYINPALAPIFESIAMSIWKEVIK